MISKNLTDKISYQINREIYSGYFYLGMASYAHSVGLKGFANWFKCQFKEELEHAEKMYDYLSAKGVRVMLDAIEMPPQDFVSAVELFEKTLAHEKAVTQLIKGLYETAQQEKDSESAKFLEWFVKEQVEEEATPASILKKIDEAGKGEQGLAKIDLLLLNRK
jgi:ferritin